MNVFICGDLHGDINPIRNFYNNHIKNTERESEENWIILLGDVGAQYYFDYRDKNFKKNLSKYPFKYFCIRGNHEERASIVAKQNSEDWEEVEVFEGQCLRERKFPNIYYAADEGGIYNINGRKCLVIPGAYSVDKHHRLMMGWSWFAQEQLSAQEMAALEAISRGYEFDFVFSHTCPLDWEPTDLFLGFIDQSSVDKSMEIWMNRLKDNIDWKHWCFAHYHADRLERPHVEIFYKEVEPLDTIVSRWKKYDETGEVDWWIPKSPAYYMT